LDFANNRGWARGVGQGGAMDAVTFTRASSGKFVGPDGALNTVASNQPRFDWGSTTRLPISNLLTFSRPENISSWTSASSDLGASTNVQFGILTGLDGTLGGAVFSGSSSTLVRTFPTTVNAQDVISMHIKSASNVLLTITLRNPSAGTVAFTYNPLTGVISGVGGIISNAVVTAAANGYVRLSFVSVFAGNNVQISIAGGGANDIFDAFQINLGPVVTPYVANGSVIPATNPLVVNPTCNGLLVEEARANRVLWCRDATAGTGTNLLTFSEQFENTAWTKIGISVASDAVVSPSGSNSADKLIADTSTGLHSVWCAISTVATQTYTFSFFVKAAEYSRVEIKGYNPTDGNLFIAVFDASNGSIVSGTGTIQNVGGGWYRCSCTGLFTAGTFTQFFIGLINTSNALSYTGDGASGILVWGAQLTPGNVLTDYQPTTTTALFGWSKSNVAVAKDQVGIDGATNAATSIAATSNNAVLVQPIVLASGARTSSVYLKRLVGTGAVQVSLDGTSWSAVDLSSTEWRRIVLSGTVTNPVVGVRLLTSGDAVAMDYAQVEDGLIATSPILTTTATVTRAADNATMSAPICAPILDKNKSTFFFESVMRSNLGNSDTAGPVTVTDAAFSGFNTRLGIMLDRGLFFSVVLMSWNDSGGSSDFRPNTLGPSRFAMPQPYTSYKIAHSYTHNYLALALNGQSFGAGGGILYVSPRLAALQIGGPSAYSPVFYSGTIKRIIYIPNLFSPDELLGLADTIT